MAAHTIPLPPGYVDELLSLLSQTIRVHILSNCSQPHQKPYELNSFQPLIFPNITVIDLMSADYIPHSCIRKLDELLQSPYLTNICEIHLGHKLLSTTSLPTLDDLHKHFLSLNLRYQHSIKQNSDVEWAVDDDNEENGYTAMTSYHLLNTIIHSRHFSSLKVLSLDGIFPIFESDVIDHVRESLFKSMGLSPFMIGIEKLQLKIDISSSILPLLFGPYLSSLDTNHQANQQTFTQTNTLQLYSTDSINITDITQPQISSTPQQRFGSNLQSLEIWPCAGIIDPINIDIITKLAGLKCLMIGGLFMNRHPVRARIFDKISHSSQTLPQLEKLALSRQPDVDFLTSSQEFDLSSSSPLLSPQHFTKLKELCLFGGIQGSSHNFENLCTSRLFTQLTHLTLGDIKKVSPESWATISHPSTFPNLKYLDLSRSLRTRGLSESESEEIFCGLSRCEWLVNVEQLKLDQASHSETPSPGLLALISSPYLTNLRLLSLDCMFGLGMEMCKAIATSNALVKLEKLSLNFNQRLTLECVKTLMSSPNLSNLTHLSLNNCSLPSNVCGVILNSPYMTELRYLDLGYNQIDKNQIHLLLHPEAMPKINEDNTYINHSNCKNLKIIGFVGNVGSLSLRPELKGRLFSDSPSKTANYWGLIPSTRWYHCVWCPDNVNGYYYIGMDVSL